MNRQSSSNLVTSTLRPVCLSHVPFPLTENQRSCLISDYNLIYKPANLRVPTNHVSSYSGPAVNASPENFRAPETSMQTLKLFLLFLSAILLTSHLFDHGVNSGDLRLHVTNP